MISSQRRLQGVLAALLLGLATGPIVSAAADESPGGKQPSPDTCIVTLAAPAEVTVSVDGRDYGTRREFTFDSLQPGTRYRSTLVVRFASGETESRSIDIEGGHVLLVRADAPANTGILEVDAPKGTKIALDGADQAAQRRWTFSPIGPAGFEEHTVTATLPGGASVERKALVLGGQHVRLSLVQPAVGPEVIPQFGHAGWIESGCFSPDGRLLLTGGNDGQIIVRETASDRMHRIIKADRVGSMALSPEGRLLASGGIMSDSVMIHDLVTGQLRATLASKLDQAPPSFSPDGRFLLISGGLGLHAAVVWDIAGSKQVHYLRDPGGCVEQGRFSPDGRSVLTFGRPGAVLWDARNGNRVRAFPPQVAAVVGAIFSPDGRQIVIVEGKYAAENAPAQAAVVVWDATTGKELRRFQQEGFSLNNNAAFTPDGRRLVLVLSHPKQQELALWDAATLQPIRTLARREDAFDKMAVSPDGRWVFAATDHWSNRDEAHLWDIETGELRREFQERIPFPGRFQMSTDGARILVGGGGYCKTAKALLWETATGRPLGQFLDFTGSDDQVFAVAMSPDGKTAVVSAGKRYDATELSLWDLVTGQKIRDFVKRQTEIRGVTFSPDGQRVLSAGKKPGFFSGGDEFGEWVLWDVASGQEILSKREPKQWFHDAAFSPDGQRFAISGSSTAIWDAATGAQVLALEHGRQFAPAHVNFGPGGRTLVMRVSGFDAPNDLLLWDTTTGQRIHDFQGYDKAVQDVAVSPDGRFLAGVTEARAALWELTGGRLLRSYEPRETRAMHVAFDPSGRFLCVGCSDGSVRWWDMATGDESIRVYRFSDGRQWIAITPEGIADGTPETLDKMALRAGQGLELQDVSAKAAFELRPGLLADVRGGQRPTRKASPTTEPPVVKIIAPAANSVAQQRVDVEVEVDGRGGPARQPWLWCGWRRGEKPTQVSQTGKTARYRFAVTLLPGENRIEVGAASSDGRAIGTADLVLKHETAGDAARAAVADANRPELMLQTGHSEKVLCVAMSPDGRLLATGSSDNSVLLWDTATGQQLRTLLAHVGEVRCVDFSPDGRRLLSGGQDGMAVLWDVASGTRIRTFEPLSFIDMLAFHPDGKRFLVAMHVSKEAQLWDLELGRAVHTFSHPMSVKCAAFSPDGRQLVVGCADQGTETVGIVWDVGAGREVRRLPAFTEKGYFDSVAVSPDGRRAVGTANFNKYLLIWDLETGSVLHKVEYEEDLGAAVFSPDGRTVAAAAGRRVGLWDARTGRFLRTLGGMRYGASRIVASANGKFLLTASSGEGLCLWDTETGYLLHDLLTLGKGDRAIAFSPDSAMFAVAGGHDDPTVTLCETVTAKQLRVLRAAKEVKWLDFSPDNGHLLTIDGDQNATMWDTRSGDSLWSSQVNTKRIHAPWSPKGDRLLVSRNDSQSPVQIVDAATGERRAGLSRGQDAASTVNDAAFSPDGRFIYTCGGESGQAGRWACWDAANMTHVRDFRGHAEPIQQLRISSDGGRLITVADDDLPILWDANTGQQLGQVAQEKSTAGFTPDGRLVIVRPMYGDREVTVWDAKTGQKTRTLRQKTECFAASADSRTLFCSAFEGLSAWDLQSGMQATRFGGHKGGVVKVAYSPDGRRLITGGADADRPAAFWDVETGTQRGALRGSAQRVSAVAYSPVGGCLLTASGRSVVVWDLAAGEVRRVLKGHGDEVKSILISADGQQVLSLDAAGVAIRWELGQGRELQLYAAERNEWLCADFSPDGRRLVLGGGRHGEQGELSLWDTTTGARLRAWRGHEARVQHVVFRPNGRHIASGAAFRSKDAILWDAEMGERVRSFALGASANEVQALAFSPDGRKLFISTGAYQGSALWDADTGGKLADVEIATTLRSVMFSADGKLLLTSGQHGALGAQLWNGETGRPLRTLVGHTDWPLSAAFSPDGKFIASGSKDGTARLWQTESGKELLRLISLNEGRDWIAVTPDGLFDGSAGGRKLVTWRIPGQQQLVPIDRFFNDFYRPGLLTSVAGGQRIEASTRLAASLPPLLKIVSPAAGSVGSPQASIEVQATDRGGGVSALSIYLNGSRMFAAGKPRREGNVVHRAFQIALLEGENRIEVRGSSGDGSWECEPATLVLRYEQPLPQPELYLVAVGVNRYAEPTMNLKFAAPDASTVAEVFRKRGPALYGADRVHITQLLDERATKAGILAALKEVAAKAKAQDTAVIFLAGHGAMVGQRYCFIPHEFKHKAQKLEDDIREAGLAGDEIDDAASRIAVVRRVVIYDTCQSGGAVGLNRLSRNPFAFRKALEQMNRTQGSFIIAATAATADAQEVPELGHGVLTYALLAGLGAVEAGPLRRQTVQAGEGRLVGVRDWFAFAQDKVPVLTKLYFNEEQFVRFVGSGTDFPILPLEK